MFLLDKLITQNLNHSFSSRTQTNQIYDQPKKWGSHQNRYPKETHSIIQGHHQNSRVNSYINQKRYLQLFCLLLQKLVSHRRTRWNLHALNHALLVMRRHHQTRLCPLNLKDKTGLGLASVPYHNGEDSATFTKIGIRVDNEFEEDIHVNRGLKKIC